jgi:hypothetical protein
MEVGLSEMFICPGMDRVRVRFSTIHSHNTTISEKKDDDVNSESFENTEIIMGISGHLTHNNIKEK